MAAADDQRTVTHPKAARRLEGFKRLLAHLRATLPIDVGVILWDGSTVPGDLAPDALALVIADEGVVAALLKRPSIDTFLNLWVTARIDIRGGWPSDIVARRPKLHVREVLKRLDKRLAFGALTPFLTVPRGGPWPLEDIHGHKARADGSEAANKANVAYHYDLSNAFYALFLDPEMIYTCAYFRDWDNDLATAQRDKLDMICRKLRLKPGDRFLDIGCGWGGLVCHAARRYGVQAHGVTLAEEQFAYAQEKIDRLGLRDRVTLELRDYAKLEGGGFDKIASVGMFEHIGLANHPTYYQTIHRLLRPGGLYLHHAIAVRWKDFERIRRDRPQAFTAVNRYIFPGGQLDHIGLSTTNLERYGFEVHDIEAWREHYARTTRLWRDRLHANREAAAREVGEVRTRLWQVAFDGFSMSFNHGSTGIFQTLASKRTRGPAELPPSRADLYRD